MKWNRNYEKTDVAPKVLKKLPNEFFLILFDGFVKNLSGLFDE